MTKIWNEVFWKTDPAEGEQEPAKTDSFGEAESSLALLAPIVVIGCLIVSIGLAAQPVFALFEKAAHQLMNPAEYIRAVLGELP
jgi:multicomponent Na+:H+ antiporter subunit D